MQVSTGAWRRLRKTAPKAVLGTACGVGLMLSLVVDQGVAQKGWGPAAAQADAKDAEAIAGLAKKGNDMPKIRIDVYEDGARAATITVPTWLVTGASRLLPKVGGKSLQDHVDINQLVELLKNPPASGVLLEIEDHKSKERLVISVVGEEAPALAK